VENIRLGGFRTARLTASTTALCLLR